MKKTDGQLETAPFHGAKAIYHGKVNGAEPQMSRGFAVERLTNLPI
jgi:hypothetical protein